MAIPGKIISIKDNMATVDYDGEKRVARLMNPEIKVGDWVVVQSKLILQSIPEEDAIQSLLMWKKAIDYDSVD